MAFIATTDKERREMLGVIGADSVRALFAHIPDEIFLGETPAPPALSEYETLRLIGERAAMNRPAASAYLNFMGAGAYEHFVPAAVPAIAQRGEFLTAYTPYQAEASQGTLQVVYEFQSMICGLTGLDVANASMYDGASALAEAALMAIRVRNINQILVPTSLHPSYRKVLKSYTHHLGVEILEWDTSGTLAWPPDADSVAGVVVQHPNFFGHLEPGRKIATLAKEHGALTIAVSNPMSLAALEPPGSWGADIAVGEVQPLGLGLNFGGPYAGYMATHKAHARKMPGRIVGKTLDGKGREAFVLTLQTREQHIRRERATSNICTNQGLCALMTTLYLALVGKSGFRRLGDLNLARSQQLFEGLTAIKGVEATSDRPFFNEFTVVLPVQAESFCEKMRAEGILAGLAASQLGSDERHRQPDADDSRLLIICATETKTEQDIRRYIRTAKDVLEKQT